jgi:hypothetical protein
MIHPRMYQLDRTSAREHRTPVRRTQTPDYGLELPSKHAGSLEWDLDPSTIRSRDRGYPGESKGPVLIRV